jgi:hypothetical protein
MVIAFAVWTAAAQPAHRRAVLVGINDYSASRLGALPKPPAERDWPNLNGATNDVKQMSEMLVLLYGFRSEDILTLTDQAATRQAIVAALEERLARPAAKGDLLLFYYAGHGSQVKNSLSDEPDKMDETLVPADSRAGVRDIRDKELRPIFNRILDRGAALTVILDNCHSGSGARGLPNGARSRGIRPDLRDIADRTPAGPRPEDRGALVIAATQDFDSAYEMRDAEGVIHGIFSWAWLRALRNAAAGEPAGDTFLRAQATVRAESPLQEPVLAGNTAARSRPFLGIRTDRRAGRTVIAVRKVRDGVVVLQGGWANGLEPGAQLRLLGAGTPMRLTVTAIRGLGVSEARIEPSRERGAAPIIRSGALAEVVGWAATAGRPLRVWMPRGMIDRIAVGRGSEADAIELLERAEDADYILASRRVGGRLEYSWVRPLADKIAWRRSPLPVATDWIRDHGPESAARLREIVLRLSRVHAWHLLESPPEARSPYRLALRHQRTDAPVIDGAVVAGQPYEVVLRAPSLPSRVQQRFVYVFVIDSFGKADVLFPRSGSVENRFPLSSKAPYPAEIPLGDAGSFEAASPYGLDTYFLLTTDEPLVDPAVLTWDGVRSRVPQAHTALEQLFLLINGNRRTGAVVTPSEWSLEKVSYEAVAPRGDSKSQKKVTPPR